MYNITSRVAQKIAPPLEFASKLCYKRASKLVALDFKSFVKKGALNIL